MILIMEIYHKNKSEEDFHHQINVNAFEEIYAYYWQIHAKVNLSSLDGVPSHIICQCYWHLHAMVKIQAFPRQGQNKGNKPQELCEGGSILMYYPNTVLCQGFSAKCKAKGFTSFNSCGRSHMLTGPRTSHDWPLWTHD